MASLPPLLAGGTIRPARFIKLSTSENHTALEADAGEFVIGVSTEATKEAPQDSASTNAAVDGDLFEWFGIGEVVNLESGGSVTAGDLLKSDADGKGVTASAGDKYGALALEASGGDGQLIEVYITLGELET